MEENWSGAGRGSGRRGDLRGGGKLGEITAGLTSQPDSCLECQGWTQAPHTPCA